MKKLLTRKALALIVTALMFATATAGAALVYAGADAGNEAMWGTEHRIFDRQRYSCAGNQLRKRTYFRNCVY